MLPASVVPPNGSSATAWGGAIGGERRAGAICAAARHCYVGGRRLLRGPSRLLAARKPQPKLPIQQSGGMSRKSAVGDGRFVRGVGFGACRAFSALAPSL